VDEDDGNDSLLDFDEEVRGRERGGGAFVRRERGGGEWRG